MLSLGVWVEREYCKDTVASAVSGHHQMLEDLPIISVSDMSTEAMRAGDSKNNTIYLGSSKWILLPLGTIQRLRHLRKTIGASSVAIRSCWSGASDY